MLKSKTFWLIMLVLCIWGTIAYKIVMGRGSEEARERRRVEKGTRVGSDRKEDFPLVLEYEDPFLKKSVRTVRSIPKPEKAKVKTSITETASVVVIQWGNVEYVGAIFNTSRNTMLATIRVEGVDHMAKEGDTVGGFRVETITRDSIQLAFGSQRKFINRRK